MIAAYTYIPDIWAPLAAAVFLAVIGLYSWRRRSVPAAVWLAAGSLVGVLWLLGIALEAAAVAPAAKVAWHKFNAVWALPGATTSICFALEYAYPGRWLTRRNLILLWLAPLVVLLMVLTNDGQLMWHSLEAASTRSVVGRFAVTGWIAVVYGMGLVLLNAAAFLWLFIRSPEHRWPVALMLFGQIAGRALLLQDIAHWNSVIPLDPAVAAILLVWTTHAIALFGFRIFDPGPAARQAALDQMREGMVVFDDHWQVASLNRSAERILGVAEARVCGKRLPDVVSSFPDLRRWSDIGGELPEIHLGTGPAARDYTLHLSPLKDFRGLRVGYLLLLHDVTEQRRAQAQLVEQQRAAAMLGERERLARELHDDLGQVLGYVKMQAQAARVSLGQGKNEAADEYLAQLIAVAQEAHADVREYILGLKTAPGGQLDFLALLDQYLQQYAQNYGMRAELMATPELGSDAFDPLVRAQLLRIIQEALANARKHASAHCVQVRFQKDGNRVEITIQDDGAGFDPELQAAGECGHFGLRFMRERAEEVGGTLRVESAVGEGTRVVVQVPVRE